MHTKPPTEWMIPGITKGQDQKYSDDDLARILQNATAEPAGAFRARGIPACMKPIDCLGMEASRNTYGLATLNEFRYVVCLDGPECHATFAD